MHRYYEDINHFEYIGDESGGTAECIWLRNGIDIYLWKGEMFEDARMHELIAHDIAVSLGIPVAEYRLAQYQGSLGVLSKNISSYGYTLLNIQEAYPHFLLINEGYALESFLEYWSTDGYLKFGMSGSAVTRMILFDYLVNNGDRHFMNIGINSATGNIAHLYDHGASFSNIGIEYHTMLYNIETREKVLSSHLLEHMYSKLGMFFVNEMIKFCLDCSKINIYDILISLEKILGSFKNENYQDKIPAMLDEKITEFQSFIKTKLEV
jgi:hypothetical protein